MRSSGRPGTLARIAAAAFAVLAFAAGSVAQAADRIRINIVGVDEAISDNVRGYLTLTRYAQRDDLTDAQVRRLADRAVDEAADALRPFGYYDPTRRRTCESAQAGRPPRPRRL